MGRLLPRARTEPGETGAQRIRKRQRRNHSAAFEAKVAAEAVEGEKTVTEVAQRLDVHPSQATELRRQLAERAADVFRGRRLSRRLISGRCTPRSGSSRGRTIFWRRASQSGFAERRKMIDREQELPIKRGAELLNISRGSVVYHPEPIRESVPRLMRRIDALHLEHPFAGSRMLRDLLRAEGGEVSRRHVAALMRKISIEAICRKPNTSRKQPAHPVFPRLLRAPTIERANQVWSMDITHIPTARGLVYLTAAMDWHSRKVLAHRVSITMDADLGVEVLRNAIARYGKPEIMNTNQGSPFTGAEFADELKAHGIAFSMDGRGQWRDNVFFERLWKTVKYEEIYLKAYDSVSAARSGIGAYLATFSTRAGRIGRTRRRK